MLRVMVPAVLLLIAWLAAGRQITAFVDRVIPIPAASLPVTPLAYDSGGFVIGGQKMYFAGTDNLRAPLELAFDTQNRTILSWGRDAFVLGPRTGLADPSGLPDFRFSQESGDEVTFTRRTSWAGWPTPFEMSILGGKSPWWRRYVYYRLDWKKRSGAKLEMLWRYEQQYYSGRGWSEPHMMWMSQTGLLSVKIQVESEGMEGAVVRYIARTKGWPRVDYRMVHRGSVGDGRIQIFAITHCHDEQSAAPGAGKSLELEVDPGSLQIIRELGGQ